jgi:hypothetical protein
MDWRLLEMSEFDQVKKWCTDQELFYLRADIKIPETVIDEALTIYDEGLFIEHRGSDGRGWKSVTLHGEGMDVTTYNPESYNHDWTELVKYAPTMKEWLQDTFPNNGMYGRCRFMLLESGGYIRKHTDTHQWKEGLPLKNNVMSAINIAITQPEQCYLRRCSDMLEVPFQPREVYWFNNGPFHEAANFSKEPRIHFIIHGGTNKARKELFVKSFHKEHPDAQLI